MLRAGPAATTLILLLSFCCCHLCHSLGIPKLSSYAKTEDKLFKNLFRNYQKWVRPVKYLNGTVRVRFGLAISQLVDVDEKNQLMTTNVWMKQVVQGWKFVALVLDRMFLWTFLLVSVLGSALLFIPVIYKWAKIIVPNHAGGSG